MEDSLKGSNHIWFDIQLPTKIWRSTPEVVHHIKEQEKKLNPRKQRSLSSFVSSTDKSTIDSIQVSLHKYLLTYCREE
jgi:hypothetical protein